MNWIKVLSEAISKNSPQILTISAVAGVVATSVLAVKATPKACAIVQEMRESKTPITVLRSTWRCYIPAAIVGSCTIACILGAQSISSKRNLALASLYAVTEKSFSTYRDEVKSIFGKNKEREVRDTINAKEVDRNQPDVHTEVIFTGNGDVLCYDKLSGRYFKSDIEKIRRAENYINKRLITEMRVDLNELYFELGLVGVKVGEDVGWDIEKDTLEMSFSSCLTSENQPCLVLDYEVTYIR